LKQTYDSVLKTAAS